MICETCKIYFPKRKVDKRDKNRFCSSKCALDACRTREHQVMAGKKSGLVIIAKYRGTGKGYIVERGRHQHRRVAEKMLGRKLRKKEIVHHKDGNPQNNKPKNLEVMTQAKHASLHYREKGHKTFIKRMVLINTKYGPKCKNKNCNLSNKKGRAYCPHHQYRFEKYGEI